MRWIVWLAWLGCQEAGAAKDVAQVLAIRGAPDVMTQGKRREAEVGTGLGLGDRVATDEGESLLLLLNNDRVVRIDEDLELAVERLVLLKAPKSTVPIADQIRELVLPEEREQLVGLEGVERIAGWHARSSAGTAVPAGAGSKSSSARRAAPSEPRDEDVVEPAAEVMVPAPEVQATSDGLRDRSASGPAAVDAPSLPAPLLEQVQGMRACLSAYREQIGVSAGVEVHWSVRVTAGSVVGWKSRSDVAAPACVRSALDASAAADGVHELSLKLP